MSGVDQMFSVCVHVCLRVCVCVCVDVLGGVDVGTYVDMLMICELTYENTKVASTRIRRERE